MKTLIKLFIVTLATALMAVPSIGFAADVSGFSSPAASASFKATGNMAVHVTPAALVAQVLSGSGVKEMQRSVGCSTGCSVGCSVGCSTGCSIGCSTGCTTGCR